MNIRDAEKFGLFLNESFNYWSKRPTWWALMNIKPFDTEIFAMDRTNFDMLDIDVCLAK